MTRITVLGGTGYAGGHIVREAVARGHQVTSLSRTVPQDQVDGVTYVAGDATDPEALARVTDGADVVVHALAPRGPLAERFQDEVLGTAAAASRAHARFGIVGGAGSLHVTEGGPLLVDGPEFPEAFRDEAQTMVGVLAALRESAEDLDWFMVSPAAGFGSYAPGERTGTYRVGGDVLLVGADGASFISGADFAIAIVDEIERPAHRRARFTVAY